jgi:cysteine desulfurase
MFRRVYLDNSATTPIDERVLDEMMPYLMNKFGNASSIHFFGQESRGAIDKARHQVAEIINSRANEIVFTSGGTEANNLAIKGLCESNSKYGKHIITSQIEHSAVKSVCEHLEKQGFEVTYLPVYDDGIVQIEDVKNAIREDTILISIMTANNEIGTIQPIREISQLIKTQRDTGNRLWFHSDAVQAVGRIKVDVEELGIDLLSISAHKIYAPKGCGALYVRRGVRLQNQNIGGHQEREKRGGTESVPLIVAFGKACELASDELETRNIFVEKLRDKFEQNVIERIVGIEFNGNREHRLSHLSNISFRGVEGEGLLINLDMNGVAVSTGSACSSGNLEPSPVIRALGRNEELARGAIRFSFGKDNSEEELDYLLEVLPKSVENLRKLSPNYEVS